MTPATERPHATRARRWIDGRAALWLVVAVGFAVRIVHLADLARLPLFARPTADSALYLEAARAWASGELPAVFFKPPLYPFVLSIAWRIAGDSIWTLRLVSVVCGTATCALVWWLARRWFGAGIALAAGLLYAVHRGAVYFEGELVEIALATAVQTAALALALRARGRGPRAALLAGVALGLGAVARPTFFPAAAIAGLWLGRRALAPALAGFVVAVLPVTLHNAVRGSDFVLVSSNGGLNFYLGNNPQADGRIPAAAQLPPNPGAAEQAARRIAETAAGHSLRPSQVSGYWLRRGLEWIGSEPARALQLAGRKLFYAWNAAEIADNEDLQGLARRLPWLGHLPVGAWLLCPLGLAGLVLAPRTRETDLARWMVAAQVAALLPFFVVARFRLPWMPLLAIFAAWTLAHGVAAVRARRLPGRRFAAVVAATAVACNLPVLGVRAAVNFDLDYRLGYAYQQSGDTVQAIAFYRESLRRDPHNALAANALGVLSARRGGDLAEAAAWVESAIALDPARAANYAESLAEIALLGGDAAAARAAVARGLGFGAAGSVRHALLARRAEAERLDGDTAAEVATLREILASGAGDAAASAARDRLREIESNRPGPATEP